MNLSTELLMGLNAAGWSLAFWLGKRQFEAMAAKIETLTEKFNSAVSRQECQSIHNRLHMRCDEMDAKLDSHGERLAGLEVAAGK